MEVLIAAASLNPRFVQCFANEAPTLAWGAGALELQWHCGKRQLLHAAKKKDFKRMRSSEVIQFPPSSEMKK